MGGRGSPGIGPKVMSEPPVATTTIEATTTQTTQPVSAIALTRAVGREKASSRGAVADARRCRAAVSHDGQPRSEKPQHPLFGTSERAAAHPDAGSWPRARVAHMASWSPMRPVAVGGIVAVGFVDEGRVLVGSHSGVAIVDALSGEPTDRTADGDGSYEWFTESPPSGTWADVDGPHTVPVAGLWGGDLPVETSDGWLIERDAQGAKVTGPDGATTPNQDP